MPSLPGNNITHLLPCFFDQDAHLGERRFHVGAEAHIFEGFRGGGADGADGEFIESRAEGGGDAFLFGHLEEVGQLHGGGEDDGVELAAG